MDDIYIFLLISFMWYLLQNKKEEESQIKLNEFQKCTVTIPLRIVIVYCTKRNMIYGFFFLIQIIFCFF